MANGDYRKHREAIRLKQRQELAARRAKQDEINAAAEAEGPAGVKITDQRDLGGGKSITGVEANKKLDGPAANKAADQLEGVSFASPAARAAAVEAGLTAESFKRRRASSESGFNKADVARIAASVDAED